MSLKTPRLDDRSFKDLVDEARARIPLYTPEWTDHNLSDPGITLIELFAWMTDIVLYRLNRVPDRNYVKFMELIGMRLHEAEAARTTLSFWLSAPQPAALTIPAATEVATVRTETEEAIIFTTDAPLEIKVPDLSHLMTSAGAEENRAFRMVNVPNLLAGTEAFAAFASEQPTSGDAFYFGFSNDVGNHLLGLELTVDKAEGAGIDPNRPPYVWEAIGLDLEREWVEVEVDEDTTLGLNTPGLVRLHLPAMRRTARNDQSAYWVRCRLDMTDTDSRYNVSPRIRKVSVAAWGGTVGATNVTTVREEVIGRSDGSPGQVFYLEHKPILARSAGEYLTIRREDGREERWQEVADFSSSQPNDRHYTIDSDTGEVRLAPALPQPDGVVKRYGALPEKGALLTMNAYRYGGGLVGNVAANTLTVLKTSLPYIQKVTNRVAAAGGRDAELLESAKMRVPHFLRSLNRAVTAHDFEFLAKEAAPGQVGRAYALRPPLVSPGEVKVLIIPFIPRLQGFIAPESLELPADVRSAIVAYLDERRLISTQLEVLQPFYQWVQTEVRIRVAPGHNPEKVQAAVEARLFDLINPLVGGADGEGWPFGRDMFASDVMAAVLGVPGVNFVRAVKLYPVTYDRREYLVGAEASEIRLPPQGVVVSYQHTVVLE
ncbi:MAG: putative baseplate assembly protein [Anaerolineae bacterium]|jgi:predicted phage baseplate assembly protein|nr:putative baseplate assembly protein [Anaerolineae bacterium]